MAALPSASVVLVRSEGASPAIGGHPDVAIECDAFTGSLGALLEGVRRHRVDLAGVPLFPICEAYFAHLIETAEDDFDAASAALLAFAYLLERKAWMLLPCRQAEDGESDDGPAAFDAPSVGEFLAVAEALQVLHDERARCFFREEGAAPYEVPLDLQDVTPLELARALERLVARAAPEPPEIGRPRRSLSQQMEIVRAALTAERRPLEALVDGGLTRSEAVWWFLALLELVRVGAARVTIGDGDVLFGLAA